MTKISNQYSLTNVLTADVVNGRVGIGTASPNGKLDITGTTSQDLLYLDGGINTDFAFKITGAADDVLTLRRQHATVGARDIISFGFSGNVGIGTTSPVWMLEINKDTTSGSTGGYPAISVNNPNAAGYAGYYFYAGTTQKGGIEYSNSANSFSFYNNGSERMRITSGGNVLIGTTTDNGYKLNVSGSIYSSSSIVSNGSMYAVGGIGSQGGIYIDYGYAYGLNSNTQNAANAWNFYVSSSFSNNIRFFYGGTSVGSGTAKAQIDTSGNYSALSDFNKKKDIALSTLGLAEVMQLKPSTFKFKDDENQIEQIGFIAQEVKDIIPQAYYEDEEGDDKFIGLKQTAFIPVLVKAIQELSADLTSAKQEIELLKAK